ncbi:helix-turn-helix domain-containing protein [Ktedonosporobacter rubrisoli]|uniref:Helix-turn-helix domain-containing protein n=1 Tax=Ktedonosporobacter rubrisoli TaxID=2509675 RepID=A0A4P6JWF6_KTERU|nr:Clp protease N-terminal domain-containing protein [Ktedonosporobacter rubrisoli]QBD79743.1 helix-turn-helix domain-containing protein [Ktedonosporobacter rubrisoli]
MEFDKEANSAGIERLMTSDEVAELLHVDPVTIRRLINKGDLAAYRIGSDYRIAPSDLKAYLLHQRMPAKTEATAGSVEPFGQLVQWLRAMWQERLTAPAELVKKERNRFDRFTERARNVLSSASEEAKALHHNYIGTEHLLLGLLREGEGIGAQTLQKLGVEADKVREAVIAIIGRGSQDIGDEQPRGLTPRAKKVIELAVDEARRLGHDYLGTEHLLLGLLREGEGIAARILVDMGVVLPRVREEALRLLEQRTASWRVKQYQGPQKQASTNPTLQESMPAEPGSPQAHSAPVQDSEPGSAQAESTPEQTSEPAPTTQQGEQTLTCPQCGAKNPGAASHCLNCNAPLSQE